MEKADLNKGYQNPKRKLGVTTHFPEIIEHKRGKKMPFNKNYGCLFIYEKCEVTHIFLFRFQQPLLSSAFSP